MKTAGQKIQQKRSTRETKNEHMKYENKFNETDFHVMKVCTAVDDTPSLCGYINGASDLKQNMSRETMGTIQRPFSVISTKSSQPDKVKGGAAKQLKTSVIMNTSEDLPQCSDLV